MNARIASLGGILASSRADRTRAECAAERSQSPTEEGALVTKRIVQTRRGQAGFSFEIANGSGLVSLFPKTMHSSVESRFFIEFSWPCHSCLTYLLFVIVPAVFIASAIKLH